MTDLAINRAAAVERIALDEHSWVDVARGFVPAANALLDEMLAGLDWIDAKLWRYEVYLDVPRMYASLPRTGEPAAVRQTALHLRSKYRVPFSGPAVLQYRNGSDTVGFHRDREMRYLDDTRVAIVVLGEPRPFLFRPHGGRRGEAVDDVDVAPGRGDLIVMGGRAQADWMHAVPRVDHATERISLTWRWTSRQGKPDSSASYGAGANFGDSGRVGPQRRRG